MATKEIPRGVLSHSGLDDVGTIIKVMEGTVDDWTIFVSPARLITPEDPGNDNMMVGFHVEAGSAPNGWRLSGGVSWRRGIGSPVEEDNSNNGVKGIHWLAVRKKMFHEDVK